jgi:hypothetical protein
MENHWSTENRSMKAFYLYSHQNKAKVLVNALRESHYIPHAARPNVFNDFDGYPIYSHITAGFVASCGHVEVIRRIGINYPLEVIGWYLCPMKPFQPRENYRKVLFAPIHPNNNGTLSSIDRKVNIDTFKILLALVEAGEIELTVRYLRKMDTGGIWEAMYPYDILTEKEPLSLFRRAITSDAEIADWRTRMIGKPFEPRAFVGILEKHL